MVPGDRVRARPSYDRPQSRGRSHGAVLGFLAQDAGEIHMLFVAPEARGRGVGTLLLEDVNSEFGVLRLDVNEQNP